MKYENGDLILSEEERALLALVTMNKIDAQYPASYFIGSMGEIKAEADEAIRHIQSKQDPDDRDTSRIEIIRHLLAVCDLMIEQGFDAAQAANSIIKMQ